MSSNNRNSRTRARQNNAVAAKESEAALPHEQEEEVTQIETDMMDVDQGEPSMQLLAEAAQNSARAPEFSDKPDDDDDRSSSLSEIDDRGATEGSEQPENDSAALSEDDEDEAEEEDAEEENDTEAETERLEPSPDKTRKQRKVLLNSVLEDNASSIIAQDEIDDEDDGPTQDKPDEEPEQTEEAELLESGISTPAESPDGTDLDLPKDSGSKKRKRATDDETGPSRKRSSVDPTDRAAGGTQKPDDKDASDPAEPANDEVGVEVDEASGDESQVEGQADVNANGENEDAMEAEASNLEDADLDEAAQEDAASSARTEEELRNKKAALEKLSDIEKDFALFRDKLFADRNTQLNRELSRIQSDPPTHPEYLSMVKAVDRLRNERIDHAKTLYRYKLQALQRKAVVTRATLQSQYMQRIREQRDQCLEQASEEWYQIQRERRNFDTDKDVPLNHFNGERPQWVAAQTAYNTEVSILSGVAKYIGFPAAPEVRGATAAEMDEDLRKMGISRQTAPPVVSAALPQVGKPKSGAEEQFIAETAWANPQHQQSQYLTNVHRQISNNLRPASPVSTPAAQKRNTDPAPNGSASTVPAHPSSSVAPTPMSAEPHGPDAGHSKSNLYAGAVDVTPSKLAEQIAHKPEQRAENGLQEIAQVPEPPTSNARTTDAVTAGVKASPPPPQRPPQSLETAPPAQMPPGVQVGSV